MRPLKNVAPVGDRVLYVFHDFETTQNKRYSDLATIHVLNLVCVQHFFSRCEDDEDIEIDCVE